MLNWFFQISPWRVLLIAVCTLWVTIGCHTNATREYSSCDNVAILDREWELHSEKAKIEILHSAYRKAVQQPDTCRMVAWNQIANRAIPLKDTFLFYRAAQGALDLATKRMDTMVQADVLWNFGAFHLQRANFDSAYVYYNRAYRRYRNLGHRYYQGKMLYNLAYIRSQVKDYTGAEILLFQAISLFEPEHRWKQLYLCYNHLGALSDDLGEYPKALEYYHSADGYLDRMPHSPYRTAELMNNMGVLYGRQKHWGLAEASFNRALTIAPSLRKRPKLYAKLLDNRAFTAFQQLGPNDSIRNRMLTAQRIRDSIGDIQGAVISRLHRAEYQAALLDTVRAISLAEEAYVMASQMQLNRDVLKALELLADLDREDRAAYLNRHVTLDSLFYVQERSVRDKFTRVQYETDRYMADSERLTRQRRIIIAISTLVGLALLALYATARRSAKDRKRILEKEQQLFDAQLYEAERKQKENLTKGKLDERVRISEELHDDILSRLFGIRLRWEFLDPSDANYTQLHQKNVQGLSKLESDIRSISHELQKELAKGKDTFIGIMKYLVEEKEGLGEVRCHFICDHEENWEQLDPPTRTHLFRILEEAMHNILRHAEADHLYVSLTVQGNNGVMKVLDDGKGFGMLRKPHGIGIKNIRSRVKKINGSLTLQSARNRGTLLRIELPLKPESS